MIDLSKLSSRYSTRLLDESDIDIILDLCRGNPQFYESVPAQPTAEEIRNDMTVTPPGIEPEDKYYFGFFEERELVAVMDLIDGYPDPETAYIGFFMMNRKYQGRNIGSAIIGEAADRLREMGKTAIRLGIDKENPQSVHFWKKNGFAVIREADMGGWTALVAERKL